MKKLVVFCALLALLVPGCKKKKPQDEGKGTEAMAPAEPMTPEEQPPPERPVEKKLTNLQAVQAGFAAFTAGKLDDATKGFGEAGEWHNIGAPPPNDVIKGAAALKTYFDMNKKVFAMKATPVRIFDGGDNIVVEAVITGTHQGDYMGLKATNKPIGFKAAYWFQMKDGKVEKVYAYVDGRALMVQLGAIKGKFAKHVPQAMAAPTGEPEIIKGKADPSALAAGQKMMQLKPTDKDFATIVDEETVTETANGQTIKGLKAYRAMFVKMAKAFTDLKLEPKGQFGVGKWAVVRVVESAKSKKLKKEIQVNHLYLGLFEGGKLKQGIMYQNALEIGMQLGLVPKPGMEPAGMEPAGMEPAGMKPAAMKPAAMKPAAMKPAAME